MSQHVFDLDWSTFREAEVAKFGVGVSEIRDRRERALCQSPHGDGIFDADPHRMTGESFGIRDDDLVRAGPEGAAKRLNLGGGRAAAGRGGRLVGHE